MELTRESVTWLYLCLLGRLPESENTISSYIQKCKTLEAARIDMLNSEEFRRGRERILRRHTHLQGLKLEDKFQLLRQEFFGEQSSLEMTLGAFSPAVPQLKPLLAFHAKTQPRVIFCCGGQPLLDKLLATLAADKFGPVLILHFPLFAGDCTASGSVGTPAISPTHLVLKGFEQPIHYISLLGTKEVIVPAISGLGLLADTILCAAKDSDDPKIIGELFGLINNSGALILDGAHEFSAQTRERMAQLKWGAAEDFIRYDGGSLLNGFDYEIHVPIPADDTPAAVSPPQTSPRPSLALSMIVKNEESRILTTLASVAPIVDFVAILDTGSNDGTIEVARAFLTVKNIPHRIESAAFVQFDQARNDAVALVPAQIDWILMLDADEQLVPRDLPKLQELMTRDCETWSFPRYNIFDEQKSSQPRPYPDRQTRLLRNLPHLQWRGHVHETIRNSKKTGYCRLNTLALGGEEGGPHIHHTGPVTRRNEDSTIKRTLYRELSDAGHKAALKENLAAKVAG